jgi:hypothetical protein
MVQYFKKQFEKYVSKSSVLVTQAARSYTSSIYLDDGSKKERKKA